MYVTLHLTVLLAMALTCLPVSPMLTSGLRPQVVMGVDAKGERERKEKREKKKRKEKRKKRREEKKKERFGCPAASCFPCVCKIKKREAFQPKKKGQKKKGKLKSLPPMHLK